MLISPSEPVIFRQLGKTSSLPEKQGVDFLIPAKSMVGVQRKAIPDLVASVMDGRLQKEVAQIQSSSILGSAILIIEGTPRWTNEGFLTISHVQFRKTAWYGLILSLQSNGLSTLFTSCEEETVELLSYLSKYALKDHHSLSTRPKPRSPWGKATNHSYALHLLQSFPGVGVKTAQEMLNRFGKVPLEWSVTLQQLTEVPGIGKVTARKLMEALSGNNV